MDTAIGNWGLADIDQPVRDRIVKRVLSEEPRTIAILVFGSYGRGKADQYSDLDLTVLTTSTPEGGYRIWFESTSSGVLHVSVVAREIDEWVQRGSPPSTWSLGFPTREAGVYLYEANGMAKAKLGDPPDVLRPASPPSLEDFIEYIQKVRRAAKRGDENYARWHARDAAVLAPGLLIPLNPAMLVSDPPEALDAALNLRISPDGYRENMLVALGLEPRDTQGVEKATFDLAKSLIEFLKERKPNVDPTPDLSKYLLDGTLESYLDS